MPRLMFFAALGAVFTASAAGAAPITLYDAAAGSLPSAQGWAFIDPSGQSSQSVAGGVYSFDSTAANSISAGASRLDQSLDTQAGFTLTLEDFQVISQTSGSTNRAGFSLLFIGSNPSEGLELAFWEDRVWIYDYSTATDFTQGIGYSADLTSDPADYALTVANGGFTLTIDNAVQALTGSLVDYSPAASPGSPNWSLPRLVYGTPNFLFFGDNTSQSQSAVQFSALTFESLPIPVVGAAALLPLGGALMLCRRRSFSR